jgi:ADP-ribosylglycohydrolase
MNDLEELKKLVMASASFTDDEKQVICLLLPYMKDEDIKKIGDILGMEKNVFDALPEINEALTEKLKQAFELVYESYNSYKKKTIKEIETRTKGQEARDAEDALKNI